MKVMVTMLAYAGFAALGGVWIVLFMRLIASVRQFRAKEIASLPVDLPTVSVCIPARNEMHALAECLERVLASNYPKLEILVLDDNSRDDTSIIIKSFAHAGVRFIPGSSLPEGWLGKNHALNTLAHEASGNIIAFMDVDTFIKPETISRLVGYMDSKSKDMVSVIPTREDIGRASVFFGTLRYFWQLVRRSETAAAASSSLWLIRRDVLMAQGGLGAYKEVVEPESALAAVLAGKYACLLGSGNFNVSYEKKWLSQTETSRRLLYPLFGQRATGAFLAVILLGILNFPTALVIGGLMAGWSADLLILAVLSLGLYMALYAIYLRQVWRSKWWLGALFWPVVIFQELVLLIASIFGYANKTITWKNRPVHIDNKS